MAIRFDAASDRLLRTNPDVGASELYTWLGWIYPVSDLDFYSGLYSLNTDDQATNFNIDATLLLLDGSSLGSYVGNHLDSGFSANGTSLTPNTWYFVAGVREAMNSYKVYLNGILDTTNTYDCTGRSASFTREEIAENYSNDQFRLNGRVFNFMSYRKVLTPEQIRAQMRSFFPIFSPPYLRLWTPMRERGFRARHYDRVKGAYWTVGGTLTDEPNPFKVSVQTPRFYFLPMLSGGTTHNATATLAGTSSVVTAGNINVPYFVSSQATDITVATQSPVITAPAGIANGDLILIFGVTNTNANVAAPGGWALVGTEVDAGSDSTTFLIRRIASGEGASWTLTNLFDATEIGRFVAIVYRNVDQTTPINQSNQTSASATSLSGPSVSPGVARCMIVQFAGCDPGTGAYAGTPDSSPVGVERFDAKDASSNAYVYIQEYLQITAAPIALDVTSLTSDTYGYHQIAIAPPPTTTHNATATLAGTSSTVTVGRNSIPFTGTLAGTSSAVTVGKNAIPFTATMAGTSSVVTVGNTAILFTATLAGTSSVVTVGKDAIPFTATMAGTSSAVTVGKNAIPFTATLAGTSSVVSVGDTAILFTATLTGTSSAVTVGKNAIPFTATMAGTSSVVTVGTTTGSINFTATLAGTSSAVIVGKNSIPFTATMAGTSSAVTVGKNAIPFTSTLAGTSALAVLGTVAGQVDFTATLAGTSSMMTAGVDQIPFTSTMTGTSSLEAIGKRSITFTSIMPGLSSIVTVGGASLPFTSTMSATSQLTAIPAEDAVLGLAYLSDSLVETAGLSDNSLWSASLSEAVRESATLGDEPL